MQSASPKSCFIFLTALDYFSVDFYFKLQSCSLHKKATFYIYIFCQCKDIYLIAISYYSTLCYKLGDFLRE